MLSPVMVMGTLTGDDMCSAIFPRVVVVVICGAGEKATTVDVAEAENSSIREGRMIVYCCLCFVVESCIN